MTASKTPQPGQADADRAAEPAPGTEPTADPASDVPTDSAAAVEEPAAGVPTDPAAAVDEPAAGATEAGDGPDENTLEHYRREADRLAAALETPTDRTETGEDGHG